MFKKMFFAIGSVSYCFRPVFSSMANMKKWSFDFGSRYGKKRSFPASFVIGQGKIVQKISE
jgi:hypothetical protein